MTVKERMLAIRLSERIEKNPEYAEKVGVSVKEETNGKEIKIPHMAEKGV